MRKLSMIVILGMVALLTLTACGSRPNDTRREAIRQTEQNQQRAAADVPVPIPSNFLTRKTVAKWVERQDTPDRPHYVYVMADTGNFIGYYVAQSRPVNTCTFLNPPEKIAGDSYGRVTIQQPALDGVYYGGGSCDQWFFFDSETDAMIELTGFKVFTSDQPLNVQAQPIRVKVLTTP